MQLFARGDDGVLALITGDDRLDGFLHVALRDSLAVVLNSGNGGLVDDVRQFRAGAAARCAGDLRIDRCSASVLTSFACTRRIASRPARSGSSTGMRRSKRPGRSSALSRISGSVGRRQNDDALARVKTVHLGEQLVERLLALVVAAHAARCRGCLPMASISSMKTMHGAFSPACLNRSRTRAAPMPTNISTNSEPEIEKNGTFASPATALRQQRFARAGRADKQRALGQLRADIAVFLRIMQEIDDLLERVLGLVLAGHVVKRLAGLRLDVDLGVGFAEAHRVSAHPLAHLAEHERAEAVENDQRQHPC